MSMDRESALEQYLRDKRKLATTTKESYAQSILGLLGFCTKELQEITLVNILAWLKYLKVTKLCSPATIRIRLSAVKSFFAYLIEEGFISLNPTIGIKGPKKKTTKPPNFPSETIFHLRDATKDNLRLRTLVEVLYCTGVRVTELINIKLQDVSLEDNLILITKAKRKIQRFVPFTHECQYLLKLYIESRKNQDDCPYLFINHHKQQITRQGVSYLLKSITGTNLETNIHAHIFRHSLASRLIDMDAELQIVADILGHKNLNNVTIYAQFSSIKRKKNYDKFF